MLYYFVFYTKLFCTSLSWISHDLIFNSNNILVVPVGLLGLWDVLGFSGQPVIFHFGKRPE